MSSEVTSVLRAAEDLMELIEAVPLEAQCTLEQPFQLALIDLQRALARVLMYGIAAGFARKDRGDDGR
jgi:hypothetical protein